MKKLCLARASRAFLLAACLVGVSTDGATDREVPDFNLIDLAGHNVELRRSEGKAVVLFFTGVGCPIARKSAPKLRSLRRRFADRGAEFWIINAYPEDTTKEAIEEYQELGLHPLPYLRDPKQSVALALKVERTAEVVVIRTEDWKVVYQGAIDDQYTEGSERPKPLNRFLETALNEILDGKPVQQPRTSAHGCRLSYATVTSDHETVPSYSSRIAPILRTHCVECHRDGGIGPWALDGYPRVKNYSRMIEEVLLTRRMPPWDADPDYGKFSNAHVVSREETQALLRWIQAGAPRGEGPDPLTEALPAVPDWALGKPDAVLRLPEPQEIPATGVLDYRHIALKSPFTNEVWLSGTDIKPGNRTVVHHVILYARWPGSVDDGSGNGVFVCGWAPGTPPTRYPAGAAKRLPAGAELNVEIHYTTSGSPQTDQSEIALYLASGPQPQEVEVRRAMDLDLNIPPGADESRHMATYGFSRPATIYALMPHMHFRGKWMRYDLLLPDGTRETLLHVPRYDFKWQLGYVFSEPRHVPAGSWMMVTGAFDNSVANPANPDPHKRVHFGQQSWDEMFIGFFDAADDPAPQVATRASLP